MNEKIFLHHEIVYQLIQENAQIATSSMHIALSIHLLLSRYQ
ncbi:hypothetical protein XSR1_40123 [Xenorhabdus szentirmaii DSM 16338]|uniref:Uncharacterized protein n=1 Tax=Xenorhabdus szentirmaii DSM 16338 TaxID=1427518 RepID=W1J2K9_9GAMM|nr:hypothetical protein XSR1_40123 [Xenorhabdus szentirmaii DSM 16338]